MTIYTSILHFLCSHGFRYRATALLLVLKIFPSTPAGLFCVLDKCQISKIRASREHPLIAISAKHYRMILNIWQCSSYIYSLPPIMQDGIFTLCAYLIENIPFYTILIFRTSVCVWSFLKVVVMKSVDILLISFLYCIIKIFNKANTTDKQEKLLNQMWFSITPVAFAKMNWIISSNIIHVKIEL